MLNIRPHWGGFSKLVHTLIFHKKIPKLKNFMQNLFEKISFDRIPEIIRNLKNCVIRVSQGN